MTVEKAAVSILQPCNQFRMRGWCDWPLPTVLPDCLLLSFLAAPATIPAGRPYRHSRVSGNLERYCLIMVLSAGNR